MKSNIHISQTYFSATSRMNTDSPGDWFGHMEKTDERALQWFAINLMTHNLQKKGLVSGTAVIVCSMMNRKLGCIFLMNRICKHLFISNFVSSL